MKKKKLFHIFTFILIFTILLSGCGSKKDSASDSSTGYSSNENAAQYDAVEDTASGTETTTAEFTEAESKAEAPEADEEKVTNSSSITSDESVINTLDKIIRRVFLEIETKEFDSLITEIDAQINQLGGYVESSEISGRYYYSEGMRYGNVVARIPKEKLDEFVNTVNDIENVNVVNKQVSTENVTLAYTDIESRKKALEIEQERLLVLLEKVDTLEDIITLESRLSSVRYELQSYETQLRTYDNLVEYSTVKLNIQEVERITNTLEVKKTVFSRIKTGLGNTMYQISESFKNFLVWFIVNLPYIILWSAFIIICVLIGKRYYRKKMTNYNVKNNASDAKQKEPEIKK